MINWMLYPHSQTPDELSLGIVGVFEKTSEKIKSETFSYKSDEVLKILAPDLKKLGFQVERSKKEEDKIHVPVLYGMNGHVEKSFEADGYHPEGKYVLEVEAGRGYVNNQFLKDFCNCSVVPSFDQRKRGTIAQGKTGIKRRDAMTHRC